MRLTIWINAFIPGDVPGYTVRMTRGRYAGKSAIPIPGVARLNPGNWPGVNIPIGAGYLTDQRGFSSAKTASRRMQSLIEVETGDPARLIRQAHTSSGTTEVVIADGTYSDFAVANMSRCRFSALRRIEPIAAIRSQREYRIPLGGSATINYPSAGPAPDPFYRIGVSGAAGDPLIFSAADIDYVGTFEFQTNPSNLRQCNVSFEGKIDAFPAFECYAEYNGTTKALFTSSPPRGNTVTDLLGGANRPIRGMVNFP